MNAASAVMAWWKALLASTLDGKSNGCKTTTNPSNAKTLHTINAPLSAGLTRRFAMTFRHDVSSKRHESAVLIYAMALQATNHLLIIRLRQPQACEANVQALELVTDS